MQAFCGWFSIWVKAQHTTKSDTYSLLPGTPLLQSPIRDRIAPHQKAGLSAGSLSGTEVSCLPEDQWSPAGWQWSHCSALVAQAWWWVCDGHFWSQPECRWWTGSRAAGVSPLGPWLPSGQWWDRKFTLMTDVITHSTHRTLPVQCNFDQIFWMKFSLDKNNMKSLIELLF